MIEETISYVNEQAVQKLLGNDGIRQQIVEVEGEPQQIQFHTGSS